MDIIEKRVTAKSLDFIQDDETGVFKVADKRTYTLGGMVEAVTIKTTRNGDNMAFITLEDLTGTVEVVVFPRDYSRYRELLVKDNKLLIRGNASVTEDEAKLLLSEAMTFDTVKEQMESAGRELWLCFPDAERFNEQLDALTGIINNHRGGSRVMVMLKETKQFKSLGDKLTVKINDALMKTLEEKYGSENVTIREIKV